MLQELPPNDQALIVSAGLRPAVPAGIPNCQPVVTGTHSTVPRMRKPSHRREVSDTAACCLWFCGMGRWALLGLTPKVRQTRRYREAPANAL